MLTNKIDNIKITSHKQIIINRIIKLPLNFTKSIELLAALRSALIKLSTIALALKRKIIVAQKNKNKKNPSD